jgi:hypothetical protein
VNPSKKAMPDIELTENAPAVLGGPPDALSPDTMSRSGASSHAGGGEAATASHPSGRTSGWVR